MVNGVGNEAYSVALSDGTHAWAAGLQKELGGLDEAPTPHRLLESALAACTILTVKLYAARKGWPLKSLDARVEILQEGPERNRIKREITPHGVLTDEQRARLKDIAEKCPHHKFLSRPTDIETV
jgi:putative redox protein